jgi:hypothetical protein
MTGFSPDDPGNVRPGHIKDPDHRARDIAEAADWIIRRAGRSRP